jgi:hypothetical protein
MKLLACEPVANDGMQMTWQVTVEREGSDKPVCVAESLTRYGDPEHRRKKSPHEAGEEKGVWVAWPALSGLVSS